MFIVGGINACGQPLTVMIITVVAHSTTAAMLYSWVGMTCSTLQALRKMLHLMLMQIRNYY